MKYWSYTDSIIVARTCTTTAYRWLFRDSRPSLRIVLCCCQVTTLFWSQNRSLLVFADVSMNAVLPKMCLQFWSSHLSESEFALSEERASTCASRSSRLTVKGCNQTGMPCVGSSSFNSLAGSRFPVACLSWSDSIGFPHACLSLRVVTFSQSCSQFSEIIRLILCSQCWRQNVAGIWWQSLYNETYWVVHCTSNWF